MNPVADYTAGPLARYERRAAALLGECAWTDRLAFHMLVVDLALHHLPFTTGRGWGRAVRS